MSGSAHLKEPIGCTEGERQEFARLVRQGFEVAAEGLDGRIRDAKWLTFHYAAGDTLAAVAALKAPSDRYRDDVFKKADAPVSPADYELAQKPRAYKRRSGLLAPPRSTGLLPTGTGPTAWSWIAAPEGCRLFASPVA